MVVPVTSRAIIDSIRSVELEKASSLLELCRKDVMIRTPHSEPLQLSVFDVAPKYPRQTLVMVHGFAASSAWWHQALQTLTYQNRVIAFDLRGHGRSSRPKTGYTVAQMAADTLALLDALQVFEPVVMVGHSIGGFIAVELALSHPQRVKKLVLVATPCTLDMRSLPFLARAFDAAPDFIFPLVQPVYEMDPLGRGNSYLLGLKRFISQDLVHWDGNEKFPRLCQPTLVINGDRDFAFPEASYERVAALIPQVEKVNVGVSKHQIPLERPKAVLRAIQWFIELGQDGQYMPLWRSENDQVNTIRILAERPWVARYDEIVPKMLPVPRVSLLRLLQHTAQLKPNQVAMRYEHQLFSYQDVEVESARFAAALQSLGVKSGERVILCLPNLPQWVLAFYGILKCGAVAVVCEPEVETEAIQQRACQAGARLIVTCSRLAKLGREIKVSSQVEHIIYADRSDYVMRRTTGPGLAGEDPQVFAPELLEGFDAAKDFRWLDFLAFGQAAFTAVEPDPGDPAVIIFSPHSSTGKDGVLLTHYNLVANVLQLQVWLSAVDCQGILCTLPFGNIFGLTLGVNLAVRAGAVMILVPEHTPDQIFAALHQWRPTILVGAPHLYMELNQVSNLRQYTEGLRLCLSLTAPLPVEVKEAFEKLARLQLLEGYGLNEAAPMTHLNPVDAPRTGSIGLPLPETEARIVSLDDRLPLPFGEIGELQIRGPQVVAWQPSQWGLKQLPVDDQGWLDTGDLARMDDDGYFQVLGRRQDLCKTEQGADIYPRDIEEVIYELPEVREVAVAAIDNRPVAFINLNPGKRLSDRTVMAYCQRRLPAGHLPCQVVFVNVIPRNNLGRVVPEALWDYLLAEKPG